MNSKLVLKLAAIPAVIVAAVAASPAIAQTPYVELGVGRSHASVDCAGTTSCDRDGTAVRAIVGYEFAPQWAVEASVADLGRVRAAGNVPGVGNVQAKVSLRSVGLGVAGTLPLSDSWSFVGRLGVASNRTSISGTALGQSASDSQRKTAATAGLALHYALSKTASVGLTLDRTEAEYDGEKAAVVAFGVGARWRF